MFVFKTYNFCIECTIVQLQCFQDTLYSCPSYHILSLELSVPACLMKSNHTEGLPKNGSKLLQSLLHIFQNVELYKVHCPQFVDPILK